MLNSLIVDFDSPNDSSTSSTIAKSVLSLCNAAKLKAKNSSLSMFFLLCLGIMKMLLFSDFLVAKNSHFSMIKSKRGFLCFQVVSKETHYFLQPHEKVIKMPLVSETCVAVAQMIEN